MSASPGQALVTLLLTFLLRLTAGEQPVISLTGPSQRTTPGNSVPFNCTAGPFSSTNFNVTWLKDSDEHPPSTQSQMTDDKGRYFVTSKVLVSLTGKEVLSQITCQVTHGDLTEPLQMSLNLSEVLQVIPTLKITMDPDGTRIQVHQRVNLTCHASHFYPADVKLIWMENRHKIPTVESPQVTRNPDGTFSLEDTLQAEVTLNGSEFSCWVVQDEQPPMQANITLRAQASNRGKGRMLTISNKVEGPLQRAEPGTSIQLMYTSSGLHTRQVSVTWLKNKHELPQSKTVILASGDTYNVTSSVLVPLQLDDMNSEVLCHVKHKLTTVFQKTINLDQYLRIPPTVTMSQSSTPSGLVAVTCHVQRFYPQETHLTWLEHCHALKRTDQPTPKLNSDGSFTLESLHLVNVSRQRSEWLVTCRVQHQQQPAVQASLILSTASHPKREPSGSPGPGTSTLTFVAFLLGVKVLLLVSFMVSYVCRRWKL
ncbi:signal-regulatory protein beta-1-like [Marmota marmota marmota]|uniref:signal-regulatory protein beta-1-like n=1 Tax=Marmota marmota marmota TaxID=9994 RepID=UPI00209235AB|nr:signal-regulatory protein beta-1-like [Marmota marmota marmota]